MLKKIPGMEHVVAASYKSQWRNRSRARIHCRVAETSIPGNQDRRGKPLVTLCLHHMTISWGIIVMVEAWLPELSVSSCCVVLCCEEMRWDRSLCVRYYDEQLHIGRMALEGWSYSIGRTKQILSMAECLGLIVVLIKLFIIHPHHNVYSSS